MNWLDFEVKRSWSQQDHIVTCSKNAPFRRQYRPTGWQGTMGESYRWNERRMFGAIFQSGLLVFHGEIYRGNLWGGTFRGMLVGKFWGDFFFWGGGNFSWGKCLENVWGCPGWVSRSPWKNTGIGCDLCHPTHTHTHGPILSGYIYDYLSYRMYTYLKPFAERIVDASLGELPPFPPWQTRIFPQFFGDFFPYMPLPTYDAFRYICGSFTPWLMELSK